MTDDDAGDGELEPDADVPTDQVADGDVKAAPTGARAAPDPDPPLEQAATSIRNDVTISDDA